jgi:hypothetical protein
MKKLAAFKQKSERFLNSLLSSIEHFRMGEDQLGLDCFLNSFLDLEMIVELFPYLEDSSEPFKQIVTVTEGIYQNMQNQDVIALTDALEFKLYPLAKKWFEGVG